MKTIELSKGYVAIVDDEDYDYLMQWNWYASDRKDVRAIRIERIGGKNTTVQMSRVIVDCPKDMVVDHINHNTLDNRKENLRICTRAENNMNCSLPVHNKSGYKGVHWKSCKSRWFATIQVNKKKIHLGTFVDKVEAARAYDKAAKRYFGEFAQLNFEEL